MNTAQSTKRIILLLPSFFGRPTDRSYTCLWRSASCALKAIVGSQAMSVSEDAAKLLWSLEVPELKTSSATDLAEAGPVSLLLAGITAGYAQ